MIWAILGAVGIIAGLLAGMFGVGGGVVLVPAFKYVFQEMTKTHAMHLAIATSSACIVLTTVAAAYAHHRRGSVNWRFGVYLLPGIIIGAAAGARVAVHLSGWVLAAIFAAFEFYFATVSLFPKPVQETTTSPSMLRMTPVALMIGMLASFVGIGGGSLMVPVMLRSGIPFVSAVGTSSAIGFILAAATSVGYATEGHNLGLPAPSLGFIYLPALLAVGLFSLLAAPMGVRLVHGIPERYGRWFFAALLYAVAVDMCADVYQHFAASHA